MKNISRVLKQKIRSFSERKVPVDSIFSATRFEDLEFIRPDLKYRLSELNFVHLTNIQNLAIEAVIKNPQTCILAETGSGKTLAYLLPVINEIYSELQTQGEAARTTVEPRGAIIFTSSKELCAQIFVDVKKLDSMNKIKVSRLGPISQMSAYVKHMAS